MRLRDIVRLNKKGLKQELANNKKTKQGAEAKMKTPTQSGGNIADTAPDPDNVIAADF